MTGRVSRHAAPSSDSAAQRLDVGGSAGAVSRLEQVVARPRLTLTDQLCVWSWTTAAFEWRLIWLHRALDFHTMVRGHQAGAAWHTERVDDGQCDGSAAHASSVAARIMRDRGAVI